MADWLRKLPNPTLLPELAEGVYPTVLYSSLRQVGVIEVEQAASMERLVGVLSFLVGVETGTFVELGIAQNSRYCGSELTAATVLPKKVVGSMISI